MVGVGDALLLLKSELPRLRLSWGESLLEEDGRWRRQLWGVSQHKPESLTDARRHSNLFPGVQLQDVKELGKPLGLAYLEDK